MKAEALDELLSHVEAIHIPKERLQYEDPERRCVLYFRAFADFASYRISNRDILINSNYNVLNNFRPSDQLPLSCIYKYTTGPVQLRYKRSRSHLDKSNRDNFSTRERECTQEQLQDRSLAWPKLPNELIK